MNTTTAAKTTKTKGICPVCCKAVALTRYGYIRIHGGVTNCAGVNQIPACVTDPTQDHHCRCTPCCCGCGRMKGRIHA